MCNDCTIKIAKLPKDVLALCVVARLEGNVPHIIDTGGRPAFSVEVRDKMFYVTAWHDGSETWHDRYELLSVWHTLEDTMNNSGIRLEWLSFAHG